MIRRAPNVIRALTPGSHWSARMALSRSLMTASHALAAAAPPPPATGMQVHVWLDVQLCTYALQTTTHDGIWQVLIPHL